MEYTGDVNISHETILKYLDGFIYCFTVFLNSNPVNTEDAVQYLQVLSKYYQCLQSSISQHETSLDYTRRFELTASHLPALPAELTSYDAIDMPESWMEGDHAMRAYYKVLGETSVDLLANVPPSHYLDTNLSEIDKMDQLDIHTPFTAVNPVNASLTKLMTDMHTYKNTNLDALAKRQAVATPNTIVPPRMLTPTFTAVIHGLRKIIQVQDEQHRYNLLFDLVETLKHQLTE